MIGTDIFYHSYMADLTACLATVCGYWEIIIGYFRVICGNSNTKRKYL